MVMSWAVFHEGNKSLMRNKFGARTIFVEDSANRMNYVNITAFATASYVVCFARDSFSQGGKECIGMILHQSRTLLPSP